MKQLIECVPNFSEGQDQSTIAAIAAAIQSVEGVKLLHQDSGFAAHRTVYTFAGEVKAVMEAAYRAIEVAVKKIDMRKHQGVHPRVGACDVCPFIPISGIRIEELVPLVDRLAQRLAQDFNIPIFLYERNASSAKRTNLAQHRIGNYENLKNRMDKGLWEADYGFYNARFGACVMGARDFLIAYNINLNIKDAKIAHEIAQDIRELGRPIGKENGKTIYQPGKLKHLKAIGWFIEEFQMAQVSTNLINFRETPIHVVFETTKELAKKYQVEVKGSELIGLIPKDCLLAAGNFYHNGNASEEEKIQLAVKKLGLSSLEEFNMEDRIIEFALKK